MCVCDCVNVCSRSTHLIVEVGPVEGGGQGDGLRHAQDFPAVLQDAAGGCGREAEQRN